MGSPTRLTRGGAACVPQNMLQHNEALICPAGARSALRMVINEMTPVWIWQDSGG